MISQLPVSEWYGAIGDSTLADAILDRIVHNSHRLELGGESMEKSRRKRQKNRMGKEKTGVGEKKQTFYEWFDTVSKKKKKRIRCSRSLGIGVHLYRNRQ